MREPFSEPEFCAVDANNETGLLGLWDGYATAGYEKIYQARITRNHRQELGKLFLPSAGVCLDAGCGTGNLFGLITEKIQPGSLYGIDWSEEMLAKAKTEAERLSQNHQIRLRRSNLAKPWLCPDNYFDAVVSNQVINYLPGGWRFPLEEMRRVLKPGGYLYLGTLLKEKKVWGRENLIKHVLPLFFSNPLATLKEVRYLKYRAILLKIEERSREKGAEFPTREEITNFFETSGFEEVTVTSTYWGGGLVLRAKRSQSDNPFPGLKGVFLLIIIE